MLGHYPELSPADAISSKGIRPERSPFGITVQRRTIEPKCSVDADAKRSDLHYVTGNRGNALDQRNFSRSVAMKDGSRRTDRLLQPY